MIVYFLLFSLINLYSSLKIDDIVNIRYIKQTQNYIEFLEHYFIIFHTNVKKYINEPFDILFFIVLGCVFKIIIHKLRNRPDNYIYNTKDHGETIYKIINVYH